jgi:nucleotide-binding universal stress UspA family protein
MAASGVEPVAAMRAGAPRTAIVDFVRQLQPALVIIGSGGKRGVRALSSVSEHVAHHVDCSVLVARAPAAPA